MGASVTQTEKQGEKQQGIEYSIYTFDLPSAGQKNQNKWEKQSTQSEMAAALAQAEQMFKTGKYQKVEVKQKYFDKKTSRNIDTTLKVFQSGKKGDINIAVILAFALLCGGAAFGITYFLTR